MNRLNKLIIPTTAVLIGLILGGVLLFVNGHDPISGYLNMITKTFEVNSNGELVNLADVINSAIPLILCGFAVGFAFKAGLFNIGAEGQFMMGMLVSIYVGTLQMPDFLIPLHPIIALLAGGIAGALWALVPALLKAYLKVNEVVVTILMNLIAIKSVGIIIQTWFHSDTSATQTPIILPSSYISIGSSPYTWGILVVVIISALYYIIFKKTKFGFELTAVGISEDASRYAGINDKQKIILALVISGALAGLGGAVYGLARQNFTVGSPLNYGFNGIVVSMLGNVSMIGIVISGLLLAFFTIGTTFISLSIESQLGEIIVAIIFICSSIGVIIRNNRLKTGAMKKKMMDKEEE